MRYRDDILIVCSEAFQQLGRWLAAFKQAAEPYQLLVESVSKPEATMLDCSITLNYDESASTSHYTKPTAQKAWLDDASMHSPSVQRTWPATHCRRKASLCSSRDAKLQGVNKFIISLKSVSGSRNLT